MRMVFFAFPLLEGGTYRIKLEKDGFYTSKKDIVVEDGRTSHGDIFDIPTNGDKKGGGGGKALQRTDRSAHFGPESGDI